MKKQKQGDKINQTQILSTAASIAQKEEIQKYHRENSDKYPNRLISYIKVKITKKDKGTKKDETVENIKGTGCLISNKYLLTAAHNIFKGLQTIDKLQDKRQLCQNISYVRQGMGLSEQQQKKFLCQFAIKQYFLNPDYQIYQSNIKNPNQVKQKQQIVRTWDFALLELTPKTAEIKEDKYMPIVVLSQKSINNIKKIQISGYPVQFSKGQSKDTDKSSVYMHPQYSSCKELKSFQKYCINYTMPTEEGISGAPIVTQYQNQHIIIGIHKGGISTNQEKINFGIGAGHMIEVLNQFGYKLEKRPFVFTEKTLNLRGKQKEIAAREILFLMDRNLQHFDMLVYTAFDLTNVKKILLSGNQIGNIGVETLLKRKYPNIKSLFLTQNKIDDLTNIKEQNWSNVQTLVTLGLNVNKLKTLPKGFMRLKALQKLWVAYNQIKVIPQILPQFCKLNNRQSLSIYIYQNQINLQNEKQLINKLKEHKTRIIWSRQGDLAKQQN